MAWRSLSVSFSARNSAVARFCWLLDSSERSFVFRFFLGVDVGVVVGVVVGVTVGVGTGVVTGVVTGVFTDVFTDVVAEVVAEDKSDKSAA